MDLTHKIEQSGALIADAGAADKTDLLREIAELLNEHAPDIVCEVAYGGLDVFRAAMDTEEEAFHYTRINAKRGAENMRYGPTLQDRR